RPRRAHADACRGRALRPRPGALRAPARPDAGAPARQGAEGPAPAAAAGRMAGIGALPRLGHGRHRHRSAELPLRARAGRADSRSAARTAPGFANREGIRRERVTRVRGREPLLASNSRRFMDFFGRTLPARRSGTQPAFSRVIRSLMESEMSDVLRIAVERRVALKAEIMQLDEFVRMGESLLSSAQQASVASQGYSQQAAASGARAGIRAY